MSAALLLIRARAAGARLATAESCTAGLVAAAITEVAGSSDMFDRGFVTYSNAAKVQMLGVSPATLGTFGAVSAEVAREMAEGALARSRGDAGHRRHRHRRSRGSEHKPEGLVCFGLAGRDRPTHSETVEFGALGRARVRAATVDHALALLLAALPG